MPVADVLRLQEYRDRRSARLRLSQALHAADRRKHEVFRNLSEIAELTGADRAAAVWVDELGSRLIHPYVVVDQLSARPRRAFAYEPLSEAWQLGVPGARDRPAEPAAAIPATFAVALGSDGTRAWFVVADAVVPRPMIAGDVRDRIMYLAGECASVVLHRDLDAAFYDSPEGMSSARFAGWDILADLEGRESNETESRLIAQRFVVARLVRMHLEDDLAAPAERTSGQVRRARAEIADAIAGGPESVLWEHTLSALESGRLEDLAETLVELGDAVEAQGHVSGALEIYRCAFEISAAVGAPRSAVDAARLAGRLTRRRADWAEAERWFRITQDIAEAAGYHDAAARALVGLGGVKKELGNLPAARARFHEALEEAEASRDRETIALVHHGLLGLEQVAGNLTEGLSHGWLAISMYESDAGRIRCVASLAGALMDFGDHDAAEDAWTYVALSTDEHYYLVYAQESLAHIHAVRGDKERFTQFARASDALGWAAGTSSATAEALYTRGLSHELLGDADSARHWLEMAVQFSERHGYNRILFEAEGALRRLDAPARPELGSRTLPAAPLEVREGLRAMRQQVASVAVAG
jgi:tetratricopeptide (TPR) repeat protein